MADVFGDLDLFSEFNKDREAQASFIHYDEDSVRARIVFEDFAEEQDSESEDEDEIKEEFASKTTRDKTGKYGGSESQTGKVGTSHECLESKDKSEKDDNNSAATESYSVKESSQVKPLRRESGDLPPTNGAPSAAVSANKPKRVDELQLTDDVERAAWLNEQLYAEAGEEAKHISTSTQQLIYERNKYRRYAKILDSTRYVPDEESPAVQLIFNNSSFARKYRQQIEQFIKGLLWEELNSQSHGVVPEITVKPGAPTCIDINSKLPPVKRVEKMRQKHAIIGNSQFHKQFLIDFLGWPFGIAEPTRCNVNWEIPLYSQVFNEVFADPTNKAKKPSKKPKAACWNCGEENHAVIECKQPRNQAKIAASRKEFMSQQQNQGSFEPKFTGPSRYHLDPDLNIEFTKFKPGVISDALQQALGLAQDQLPQHIYKMRLFGYPPGWLAEARKIQSGVSIFDKNGRVTLITGECLEDGELAEDVVAEKSTEYDVNKIVEYPGFTIPVPLGYIDEHSVHKMPPIQQHQLKKTLMTQNKKSTKKRKRDKDQKEHGGDGKKTRTDEPGHEDGEIKATVTEKGEMAETKLEDKDSNLEDTSENSIEMAAQTPSSFKTPEAKATPDLYRSSSTISLSRDFGTPVLVREKSGLPDASRFGQGIEEHIPYENLPNSTGTFDKMRDLIETIRKKNQKKQKKTL